MRNESREKILCVDDEENILHMFQRTLGRQFQLLTASSATQALKLIDEHHDVAVIVSDYNMPGVDGLELLQRARLKSPDSVQILLTGNIDLTVAIKAINETDIFRYLPKPCPTEVLGKVVNDALDLYHLIRDKRHLAQQLEQRNTELAASNAELAKQKYLLEYELEMAKIIFGKVCSFDSDEASGLDYLVFAKETVGGDFLLTHTSQDCQTYYLMLGDLTGHGLQSALAVLLVTEIFDALCAGTPTIEHLAQGINDKMCRKLPTGLFCAATLLKFDVGTRKVQVWQGGMPDALLLDQQGHVIKTIASNNLPLGVAPGQDFSTSIISFDLDQHHASSLLVYSDGVTEQSNCHQQMFGSERLKSALLAADPNKRRIDFIIDQLHQFQQQHPQNDDISLFELHFSRLATALEPS